MKYKAFISYRHTENGRRHAIALETALKRYAKPTLARPISIFRDEKHMKPDISLPKLIREGLENSEYLIFLAEKSSAESQWCGEELEYWCSPANLNRTSNLIIILIDDDIVLNETHSVNFERTTALPRLLQQYLTSIPLYLDLRWAKAPTDTDLQNPKYRQEINALAARLRGVSPEDLNDEEIRVFRRNIRLRNGAIGVLLAMLLVSVAAAAWAFSAQQRAEANLAHANKLLGAMYFHVDRFALTYTAYADGGKAFHFIDENGDPVEKLQNWERAEQFDYTNFARVVDYQEYADFLLDTNGNTYRSAYKIPDINEKMEAIDLRKSKLETIPSSVFGCKELKVLLLNENSLVKLPAAIQELKNLKSLYLFGNEIDELPAQICGLDSMVRLDLYRNKLSALPKCFGAIPNLSELHLGENMFFIFPKEVCHLKNLVYLSLNSNQLDNVAPEIEELHNLKTLLLNGNKIKGLPDQLFHLQQLTVLDLSGNQLVNLSPEIARLQNLQMLNLSGNDFVTLPVEAFKQMPNLKRLVLKEHWDDSNLTKEIVAALGKAMPWCEIAFYE